MDAVPQVEPLEPRLLCSGLRHRPAHRTPASGVQRILAGVNAARVRAGVPPLAVSAVLAADAQRRASAEAACDCYFADGGFPQDVTGYAWSVLAQNDAWEQGYPDPPGRLLAQWLASPPHRANLLDPSVADTGIGLAHGPTGWYAVEIFGSPA